MKVALVTGSSGLVGSETVRHFDALGWRVVGVDNNMRADFFGPGGDTRRSRDALLADCSRFSHLELDIRDRQAVLELLEAQKPALIVHAAAQPSHDLAASRPFDDFDTNAVGTLNMLEATRRAVPGAVFVHFSTNKVYGDRPNDIPMTELEMRWDYSDPKDVEGIDETMSIDHCMHSLFGASKVAADILVQEYGRYFDMSTCCLRGGCLTGGNHAGVELHGFLSYLVKCNVEEREYQVFGYGGKQVRDNIDAHDIVRFIEAFVEDPGCGEVFNLGGGRGNSISILEAFAMAEARTGKPMKWTYREEARKGDHVCYISDLSRIRGRFPGWDITRSLDEVFDSIVAGWQARQPE